MLLSVPRRMMQRGSGRKRPSRLSIVTFDFLGSLGSLKELTEGTTVISNWVRKIEGCKYWGRKSTVPGHSTNFPGLSSQICLKYMRCLVFIVGSRRMLIVPEWHWTWFWVDVIPLSSNVHLTSLFNSRYWNCRKSRSKVSYNSLANNEGQLPEVSFSPENW